jgi:multicomponent Na+:H+ antiporter subunit F
MSVPEPDLVARTAPWLLGILSLAVCLTFVRLIRGPSLPDRVVALDLLAALAVGIAAIDAIAASQPLFLDAAIVLALIAFLGTVAFARYVEKGSRAKEATPWRS